jgi:hypothetical protein
MNKAGTIRVARCDRCGLCFPVDYYEQWGRKYGIGLGPVPKCEGLASNYAQKPLPDGFIPRSVEDVMHPLHTCGGSVTLTDVSEQEALDNVPILAIDDPGMRKRAQVMREHQAKKSKLMAAVKAQFKVA